MTSTRFLAVAAAFVLVFGLIGCGSDDDSNNNLPNPTATAVPNTPVPPTAEATATESVPSPTSTFIPTATPVTTASAIFRGALPQTNGRFSFQATIGIAGAEAECDVQFAGSHACTVQELQAAAAAGELSGAQDIDGNDISEFWAIDPSRPAVDQCEVSVPWDYATAHTGQFADAVALDASAGTLGALREDTICATQKWVGCCM